MIKQEQKEKNDPISFLAIHSSTWMNEERERSPFKHRNLHRLFFFSQLLTLIYLLSAEKKQKSWMLGTFSCQVFLLADKLFFFSYFSLLPFFVLLQIFYRFLVYQNDSLRLPLLQIFIHSTVSLFWNFYIYAGYYIYSWRAQM